MNLDNIIQLGALGVIAFFLIMKDTKRDDFIQTLFTELKKSLDGNTSAISKLTDEFRKGNKNDSANK